MRTFLRPAIAVTSRLQMTGKLVAVLLVMLVPLGIATTAYWQVQTSLVAFSEHEHTGVTAVRPAIAALVDLSRNRIDVASRHAPADVSTTLSDLSASAAAAASLDVGGQLTAARDAVQSLAGNRDAADPAFERAAQAVAGYVQAITVSSNLILDPKLDSYYLMDAVTSRLTELVMRSASVQALSSAGTSGPAVVVAAVQLDQAANALAAALHTTTESNSSLGRLETLADPVTAEAGLLAAAAQAGHRLPDGGAQRVVAGGLQILPAVSEALDHLLLTRIDEQSRLRDRVALAGALSLALALYLSLGVFASLRSSLGRTLSALDSLSSGDLRRRVEVVGRDEFGRIGARLETTRVTLASSLQDVAGDAKAVRSAATALAEVAAAMDAGATALAERADDSAAAASDIDAHMQSMAVAMEQMHATVSEIARQASSVSAVASRAAERAEASSGHATAMGRTAASVAENAGLITTIADRTKLLALNATIEAARAGDAGKGFAVVAGEVKELALMASHSAQQIVGIVSENRELAQEVSEQLASVTSSIEDVNGAQATVASAVEEQLATVASVTDNVNGVALAVSGIAETATATAGAASDVADGARSVLAAVSELDQATNGLLDVVGRFTLSPTSGEPVDPVESVDPVDDPRSAGTARPEVLEAALA